MMFVRRRLVRVADAQVNQVAPVGDGLGLEFGDLAEQVGRDQRQSFGALQVSRYSSKVGSGVRFDAGRRFPLLVVRNRHVLLA